MKRLFCVVPIVLTLALTGCSGGNADDDGGGDNNAAAPPGTITPASPTGTAPAAPTEPGQVVGPSRTMGAPVPGSDQGKVEITTCKGGEDSVEMTAKVTNTTKETRTYIITGMAYGEDKKVGASAALMVDGVEPGKSKETKGTSNTGVKGKVSCEVAQIDSMAVG